ncbi:MAG: hypothetical protein D6698_16630 [Gammaproteobacteria bacterium]|nr:MAG: hypothetical protein D6698_16630 [Gammaproteobacteria bacterium]
MPNKPWEKLNEIDRTLRRLFPPGPNQETVPVKIEMLSGFELFNTRPYHNYDDYSDGWRIEGGGVVVQREDLDDAVREFSRRVKERRDK